MCPPGDPFEDLWEDPFGELDAPAPIPCKFCKGTNTTLVPCKKAGPDAPHVHYRCNTCELLLTNYNDAKSAICIAPYGLAEDPKSKIWKEKHGR